MNKNFVKNDTLDGLEGHRGRFPGLSCSYFGKCKFMWTQIPLSVGCPPGTCIHSVIAVDTYNYSAKANLEEKGYQEIQLVVHVPCLNLVEEKLLFRLRDCHPKA